MTLRTRQEARNPRQNAMLERIRPWMAAMLSQKPANVPLKKIFNRILVEIEYQGGFTRVRGVPYILFVDTFNSCNLRCPLCPTGTNMKGRKRGTMRHELFTQILEQLGPYAVEMLLYNWGEPLLHPEIFSFVREADARGIRTLLSSNMNIFSEERAREMISSGLARLIISLDGVTSETYRTYRIGGSFEEVKKNVKLLAAMKRSLGSPLPRTTLQFLVFRHNEHEVPMVKRLAAELEVDEVHVTGGYLGGDGHTPHSGHPDTRKLAEQWLSPRPRYRAEFDYFREDGYLSTKRCYFLWRTATVNWDGSITPCCCVYDERANFGNLTEEPFPSVWNNSSYRSSRALFGYRPHSGHVSTVCATCKIFRPPLYKR